MPKNDDISHIKSSMKQQILNLLKFHACLAYLLELGYDVVPVMMLCHPVITSLNVSSNPDSKCFIGKLG